MPRVEGKRRGSLLVPLVIVGAAVVVLSTAAEGRARFVPFGSGDPRPFQAPSQPAPTAAPVQPGGPPTQSTGPIVATVLTVLAVAVAVVIAIVLIRLLVSAIRTRRRRGPGRVGALDPQAEAQVADAPTVLRGIAAARAAVDEQHRDPTDAIVLAWLGLQQAAEDAGFARSAAETPTEFTGRVLSRTGADRVALGTLLRLYLQARFGDDPITAADTTAARDALQSLEASWERLTAEPRP